MRFPQEVEDIKPGVIRFVWVDLTRECANGGTSSQKMDDNKFRKRSGTTDFGKKYEDLNISSLVLKLVTSPTIATFTLSSNDEKFGDFDDIVVEIRSNNDTVKNFALQMKHTNDAKTIPLQSLANEKGDFSLKKYLRSYKEISGFELVLFTNRKFDVNEKQEFRIENFSVRIVQKEINHLLNTSSNGKCYQFESVEASLEYEEFFEKFYLYVNQASVGQMEKSISEDFQKRFYSSQDKFDTFLMFISKWSMLEGKKEKLDKNLIKGVIALNLLSNYIKPLAFGTSVTNNMQLFRQAVAHFEVTIFKESSYDKIKTIWGDLLDDIDNKEVNKTIRRFQLKADDYSKILWLMGKTPLLVTESNTTYRVIEMCQNKRFILFGNTVPENRQTFRNLADLKNLELSRNIKCCFQEKEEFTLQWLIEQDENFEEVVTTDDLLLMLQGTYLFGGKKKSLPEPYIPRFLTKSVIHFDYLNKNEEKTVVINGIMDLDKFRKRVKNFNVIRVGKENEENCITSHYDNLDFRPKLYVSDSDNPVDIAMDFDHQFKLTEDGNLEWLTSTSDITDLKQFSIKNFLMEEETFCSNVFQNNVHLVIGTPGMGKTILVKRIENLCSKFWTIVLLPKDASLLCQHLEEEGLGRENFERFILTLFKDIDIKVLRILMRKNRVMYIWDSIDEVTSEQLLLVVKLIQEMRKQCVILITSRPHLQTYLENSFNVLSKSIVGFNDDQKILYIRSRLDDKYDQKIQMYINQEILNTPLQIYLLTELFREDMDKYLNLLSDSFNVADLYQYWIDQKFSIYYHQKFNCTFPHKLLVEHKNYICADYEKVALSLLLPKFFDNKYESCSFLAKIQTEGDYFGFITHVTDGKVPIFLHNSFAEFFAARYLSQRREEFITCIFEEEYMTIRYFFDLIMAKNSLPHVGVLYCNMELLGEYEELKTLEDMGGRSVLHLACSWGQTYPFFKIDKEDGFYIIDNTKEKDFRVLKESPGYRTMLEFLLNKCDSSHRDKIFNATPLTYAEKAGCLFAKFIILQKQNKKLTKLEDMASLLYYAAEFGYEDIIDLYQTFPFIKLKKDNSSLLHHVVGYQIFLKKLLTIDDYQKNINDLDGNGQTPLHKACKNGFFESAKLLIENKAVVVVTDKEGLAPIHLSCLNGHFDISKLLIESGVDPNICSNRGFTPLHLACQNGHHNVVNFLLEVGSNQTPTHDGWFPLHLASNKGHDSIAKLLIASGAKINAIDTKNVTALHLACHEGHELIVKLLLESNANVDVFDNVGLTPLHLACHKNNLSIVKLLLQRDARVDVADNKGLTTLHWVCDEGHYQIAELLIASGSDIEAITKSGSTPLNLACRKGHESIVTLLLAAGASQTVTSLHIACKEGHERLFKLLFDCKTDLVSKEGSTALHWACFGGNYNIVEFLIEHSANVEVFDNEGTTPLLLACYQGFDSIVKLLIHSGANIDVANNKGFTPLHWASQQGHASVIKILMESGVKSSVTQKGFTPLHLSCQKGHHLVAKLLLEDIDAVTNSGWSALHWAAFKGHKPIAELLLKHGAKTNVANNEAMTPIHLASFKGHTAIVELLMDFGDNFHLGNDDGNTPLHVACQEGHKDVVELLAKKGCDVNIVNNIGKAPIHFACFQGHTEVVDFLIGFGANLRLVDCEGRTPLHLACLQGHQDVVALLEDKGGGDDGEKPLPVTQ